VATAPGRIHDFELFRRSRTHLHPLLPLKGDLGYLGLKKLHPNSEVPKRRNPRTPLTPQHKAHNRTLSSKRVAVEHAIRKLKVFRILTGPYRNRRKRFNLRVHLIAGIVNYELAT
jgi:DDE superfamily endonuclease